MHFSDGDRCTYFGTFKGNLVAIGWLEAKYPISTEGNVGIEFIKTIATLLQDAWQPSFFAGLHNCDFCKFSGGPKVINVFDSKVNVGMTNLFVPSAACVYVAPSTIVHYIDAHGYVPPQDFQTAVLRCPQMNSPEYHSAIQKHDVQLLRLPPKLRYQ